MNVSFARKVNAMLKTGWTISYLEAHSSDCAAHMKNEEFSVWINPCGVETYRFSHILKHEVPAQN